jgi:TRAP-type C4-dicarboxylate transport system permease small subunit
VKGPRKAAPSNAHEGRGLVNSLNLLDRWFGAVVEAANAVASAWLFVMMAIVVLDVLGRFLFSAPIDGSNEITAMSVIAVLYMQIPYTLRAGRMTRSDAFHARLTALRPRFGNGLAFVYHVAGACLMAAIMFAAWPKWLNSYHSDFYVGVKDVFTFPEWPMLLIIFLGCGMTAVQFLVFAVDSLRTAAARADEG